MMFQKRFEGTRVTIETFMAWKAKFDAERIEVKRLQKDKDLLLKKPSGVMITLLHSIVVS